VARDAAPEGAFAYVYSAESGILVAGSDWTPGAYADRLTGQLVYDRIDQLPERSWSQAITPADAATTERKEIWVRDRTGNTLIILAPLAAGGLSPSTERTLRVAIVVPEAVAVSPVLVSFVQLSLGLVAAPFAVAVLFSMCYAAFVCLRRCCNACLRSMEERPEEEEEPLPDGEWDNWDWRSHKDKDNEGTRDS